MDILTLLKANIRRRKGSFISIAILMFIIAMALTLILSVSKSCKSSLMESHSHADTGNVTAMIKDTVLSDEMRQKLDDEAILDHYKATPVAVISHGMTSDKTTNSNSCFLSVMQDDLRLVNASCTGYADNVPPLSKGEIYLSYGSKNSLKCDIGDRITAHSNSGDYDFTVKGFVTEPIFGCANVGWKWQFVSQEDFDSIYAANLAVSDSEKRSIGYMIELYKTDDCGLSDGKFRRQVNLDTEIISNAWGSLTKEASIHYTNIYSDNILGILLVFILILAIVVLIVTGHSISTGIELDYTNLGILKAQGFGSTRIRLSILLQYFIAEVVGSIVGIIAAVPFISIVAGVFDPISGYITKTHPALGRTILYLLCIFAASVLFILIITHKVCRISPIRAISGGRNEIYFDSRLKAPISAKFLSSTIALRQFTSAKRRYLATIIIAAILVFFMLMVNALSEATNSKTALRMMGADYGEVLIRFDENKSKDEIDKILDTVREHDRINTKYFTNGFYMSVNGEEIYCSSNLYPEDIYITKGRAPKYDNEIIITEMVAEELGLKIGDTVSVAKYENHDDFIVCGFYPSLSDTGMATSVNVDAAAKLGIKKDSNGGVIELEHPEKAKEIKKALEEKYGSSLKISLSDDDDIFDLYDSAVKAIRIVIYSFSLFFALIVVVMVSSKAFTQEKTDIGIYKSQGFTNGRLRLLFAVRFLIISILGALLGTVMGSLLINKLLSVMLKGIGITNFHAVFSFSTVAVPATAICVCFFIFALLASRRIKKVGIRQLVTE